MPTPEEIEAQRKADEEEAKRKAAESEESSDEEENEEELTVAELKEKLEKAKRHAKNKEQEAARVQGKLATYEKAEADRKAAELTEVEKAEAKAKAAEAEKLKLEQENKLLKMQSSFNSKVRELKLEFVNEVAAQDAFKALDVETIGDDLSGMEAAIKTLVKDRSYLFGKEQQTVINDGSRKGKGSQEAVTAEAIAKKRKGYAPL